jgi:hypothetical protein
MNYTTTNVSNLVPHDLILLDHTLFPNETAAQATAQLLSQAHDSEAGVVTVVNVFGAVS